MAIFRKVNPLLTPIPRRRPLGPTPWQIAASPERMPAPSIDDSIPTRETSHRPTDSSSIGAP